MTLVAVVVADNCCAADVGGAVRILSVMQVVVVRDRELRRILRRLTVDPRRCAPIGADGHSTICHLCAATHAFPPIAVSVARLVCMIGSTTVNQSN